MSESFVAYVDESGCTGFKFSGPDEPKASTDWFVLSAVVVSSARDLSVRDLTNDIRKKLGKKQRDVLHFSKLRHDQRVFALEAMVEHGVRTISIAINKRRIDNPEVFEGNGNRLYYYAARLLLERISWSSRDTAKERRIGCKTRIRFEHKRHASYDDLRKYLNLLKDTPKLEQGAWEDLLKENVQIHWPAICAKIVSAHQKKDYSGLQMADLVASGVRWGLEPDSWGRSEHRYAKILRPTVYELKGNTLSYGMKFFPKPPEKHSFGSHWVFKHYK